MALNPAVKYPGRITAPDANYAYGSSKDETSPGAGDGTPYEVARANDIFGLQQALLRAGSIVPTNTAETQLASQYLQALVELISGRAQLYDDTGVVNAYVLTLQTNQQGPAALFDGMTAKFEPGATNTAASTVNVNGFGVKNIFLNGVALAGGEVGVGRATTIIYDLGTDRFNLVYDNPIIITDYLAGRFHHTFDDGLASQSFFPVSSIVESTWESVGKTGSPADNIWTAMDILPASTVALICSMELRASDNVPSAGYGLDVFTRRNGSAAGTIDSTLGSLYNIHSTTAVFELMYIRFDVTIPVAANGLFDLRWEGSGSIGQTELINLEMKGFIA